MRRTQTGARKMWGKLAGNRRALAMSLILVAVLLVTLGVAFRNQLFSGSAELAQRPGAPLAAALNELRGDNDLVLGSTRKNGVEPSLYETAYGRLEHAAAKQDMPRVRVGELMSLAAAEEIDTEAWRSYYVCLTAKTDPALDPARVIRDAGIMKPALDEISGYFADPDRQGEDLPTSVTTRAAFLSTLHCLSRDSLANADDVRLLADEAGKLAEPVPVLLTADALRERRAGSDPKLATGRFTAADAGEKCDAVSSMGMAAIALLTDDQDAEAAGCLRTATAGEDAQTRWLARRALADMSAGVELPAPRAGVGKDGLVNKVPRQLGTLRATYHAARALALTGALEQVPKWLRRGIEEARNQPDLARGDRIMLGQICDRLTVERPPVYCGDAVAEANRLAADIDVPPKLTQRNYAAWHDSMVLHTHFQQDCPTTEVTLPKRNLTKVDGEWIRALALLMQAGCEAQARELIDPEHLVRRIQLSLDDHDLLIAADAYYLSWHTDADISNELTEQLSATVLTYRSREDPALFSREPGGAADIEATAAAYLFIDYL